MVQVGTAGHKNLEAHRASKACRRHAKGAKPEKANQVLDMFFKPRAPLNPSTVSAPPPIRPEKYTGDNFAPAPEHMKPREQEPANPSDVGLSKGLPTQATMHQGQSITGQLPMQHTLDKKAVSLLQNLKAMVKQIPSDIPNATPEHRLGIFTANPHACVAGPGEDDWMILNQMMKLSFGWGEQEMASNVPHLLNRGPYGLNGFISFMTFFVRERGLQGALFETKVEAILKEIETR